MGLFCFTEMERSIVYKMSDYFFDKLIYCLFKSTTRPQSFPPGESKVRLFLQK